VRIGFIGFGEAGSTIAGGLRSAGVGQLAAFDIHAHTTPLGALIQQRARQTGTMLVDSSAALTRDSDIIFSIVTSSAALDAGIDWQKLADYMVGRVVVHGERRAREMEEVAETLRAIGIEPIMAEATARRQDWAAQLDLRAHFGLGRASHADRVEVRWPSGTVDVLRNVEGRRVLAIREGAAPAQ